MLSAQNELRVPWLVPVRHVRMSASPFTFYRGTAGIMAGDLARTPVSGLDVQLIGDAHLLNFGAYASPERRLVFDANDFDETRRGPWEWDVKRLAVSFLLAGRHLGFPDDTTRSMTARAVSSYRSTMRAFGRMGFMELWYEHTPISDVNQLAQDGVNRRLLTRRLKDFERRARSRNSLHALRKLTVDVEGRRRIRSARPVLVPVREVLSEYHPDELEEAVRSTYAAYLQTLRDDRRLLLERYELVDVAVKVVGVGSVGTRCFVLLLEGRDSRDPLFLQAKESTNSVLEPHLGPSRYTHQGRRVVEGQRQIQAQSDICLGWATGAEGRDYYIRQLRDWKRSFDIETASPTALDFYARLCGEIMARGHARSGDPVAIAGYMGADSTFDDAIVEFSARYADQTVEDYRRFRTAIADGTLPTAEEAVELHNP